MGTSQNKLKNLRNETANKIEMNIAIRSVTISAIVEIILFKL